MSRTDCYIRGFWPAFAVKKSRPTHAKNRGPHETYSLVGSVYVHGVMDGELNNERSPEKAEDIWLV